MTFTKEINYGAILKLLKKQYNMVLNIFIWIMRGIIPLYFRFRTPRAAVDKP